MAEIKDSESKGKKEKTHAKKPVQESVDKVKKKVRFMEYVLDGDKKVKDILTNIKGIGFRIASALSNILKLGNVTLGELNDEQISKLENVVKNLQNYLPAWMLNHRNDQFTGKNLHYVGSDLNIAVKQDIDFMKKIKCYKGVRHILGQPVRGQRTRTSFRKGESVGVIKKKEEPAKAKPKTAEAKK